jgi:hypothetical protein
MIDASLSYARLWPNEDPMEVGFYVLAEAGLLGQGNAPEMG